jgi:hypothetical protein
MRKTSVKNVLCLVAVLLAVLSGIMLLRSLVPQLLERFDNPLGPTGLSCDPALTSCPEGQFCLEKQCYHRGS